MKDKKEKIEKIVVKSGDELIDVVRDISSTEAKKILVSFVEDSDILISSINLKVLVDSADEKRALLILQIPNNPTGVRNAKLAGIPVIDSPSLPSEEEWNIAKEKFNERGTKNSKMNAKLPKDYKSENITSFEERINSVLDKNKADRKEGIKEKVEEKKDEGIVVDKDFSNISESTPNSEQGDLTKVDFREGSKSKMGKKSGGLNTLFSKIGDFFKKFKNKVNKEKKGTKQQVKREKPVTTKKRNFKQGLLRALPKVLIPLVVVLFLVGFLYYRFAPFVRATIFIESKPVEVEKTFTGNENINEINFENLEIPIKKETVTKSVSDTVEATGTAFRGEKATGQVRVLYINTESGGCPEGEETISLSQGHKITTQDGSKSYILTGNLTAACNDYSIVSVEALEVGEEYNIESGVLFSVSDYNQENVYATNSAAFTGGSKEEYTVLSQKDVNSKVEELTKLAKEEAESSLTDIGNGWEIIDSTINSKVKDGSIKSAAAIGTETTTSDVSLEVEASATYYYTQGVDEGLNNLLTEAAKNQNLFESEEGLNLTLTGDIEKDLSVKETDGNVEITLTASSSVEPSVNKEKIVETLQGMSWEEGREYLNNLTFTSDTNPTVLFEPESFPKNFRHFPTRQGRIHITVNSETSEN